MKRKSGRWRRKSLAYKVNTNEVIFVALLFNILSTHIHPYSVDVVHTQRIICLILSNTH